MRTQKCGTLHDFACHPCAGAMLIFSVSFQFQYMYCRSKHTKVRNQEHILYKQFDFLPYFLYKKFTVWHNFPYSFSSYWPINCCFRPGFTYSTCTMNKYSYIAHCTIHIICDYAMHARIVHMKRVFHIEFTDFGFSQM